jgi:hypothetical protein
MHKLKQQARENEQTLIHYLASFDCLTKKNVALLLHGKADNSALTYADRITKRLMRRGWIDREVASDNVYRYFLAERGTLVAAETLPFLPRNGHDRSYLNVCSRDLTDRMVIEDMWCHEGIGLGRGALRYLLDGKLKMLDGVLTTEKSGKPEFLFFYISIASLGQNAMTRYERCRKLAGLYKIPLKIIAPDFIKKTLQKRNVTIR